MWCSVFTQRARKASLLVPSEETLSCLAVLSLPVQAALYPKIFLLVVTWHGKLCLFLLFWIPPPSLRAGLPAVLCYLFWFSGWESLNPSCREKNWADSRPCFSGACTDTLHFIMTHCTQEKPQWKCCLPFKGDRCPNLSGETRGSQAGFQDSPGPSRG